MDCEGILKAGSESQDSDEPAPPGISKADFKSGAITPTTSAPKPSTSTIGFKLVPSQKGVENAKKRLRAFSIQKKNPIAPVPVPKAISGGSTTVFIGKLNNVKTTPKVEKPDDPEQKKPPKPPKPGQGRKVMQDSYTELQKRTLHEIEDMKRKMELVDLGIPLGLICPSATNDKAMPTKAMPPIKTFLDPGKLDEIIREAKKAKAEGREFKFDYQKILPDYDNPFQRKRDEIEKIKKIPDDRDRDLRKKLDRDKDKSRRKSDKYEKDSRRHSSHRKDDKDKRRDDKDKHRDRDKSREKTEEKVREDKKVDKKEEREDDKREQTPVATKKTDKPAEKDPKETDVNLSEYLVCDSWSLDNEDRPNFSPKPDDKLKNIPIPKEMKPEKQIEAKKDTTDSPKTTPAKKIEKLQPVIDSFKFEIDPNDDELLDMFDESSDIEKFATKTRKKDDSIFDSPIDMKLFDFDQSKGSDVLTDDTFLESVINEIKQEGLSDEDSQDKGLVEYDSPSKESQSPRGERISVTPELDERMFVNLQSRASDYSDGYRSTESGYKSTESGYKSSASSKGDSYRASVEKELVGNFNKFTVDSLETWSFVLKICQPLLFRHDNTKCFRYTRTMPKIWYSEKAKICPCVKDREIVYNELETCKMNLVDRVYGCDQIPEVELPKARSWYPRFANCLSETSTLTPIVPSSDWEADDSQNETPLVKDKRRSSTPQRSEEVYLDREYQRFMEAVWPDVAESKSGTPRSTTPVRQENRKKKAEDREGVADDKKKAKKMKLSSEGWSQESDIEEEVEKSKKMKDKKIRKRKHSSSLSDSDEDTKKKKKSMKKKQKDSSKTKAKLAKRRRLSKKYLKKLKEKQKRKKKIESEDEDDEKENKKKEKKLRKKKQQKKKKAQRKKKAKAKSSSSSSSSSTSTSSSDTDSEAEKKRKKKKNAELKKKKRKKSSSESTQSEELFDVNILNNIKTERLTDDEKKQSLVFSPRRQKPREIINVKELQNDFVGNNIHIKKEVEETTRQEVVKMADIELEEKEFATESDPVIEPVVPEVTEVHEIKEEISFQEIPLPAPKDTEQNADKHTDTTIQTHEAVIEPSTPTDLYDPTKPDTSPSPPDKESQESQEAIQPQAEPPILEESNLSQCSSQESTTSKDHQYEKDDSHLRPSSQNSNYSFNDVINASQHYQKDEEEKFQEYEQGNYEMYEQLAMAYQSDVAKQSAPSTESDPFFASQRIETVVRARSRGEIKCDWRAGDEPSTPVPSNNQRPSRWGLKPGQVNIVLTGGDDYPPRPEEPVYQIQTIANRSENNSSGSYDEAYEDMYGASDRLQYGDCFNTDIEPQPAEESNEPKHKSSLDDRIDQALRTTVLGEVAKETDETDGDKEGPEKGILVTKPESRGAKRVSFADGYKPGQDSDVEEPPVKKKKKPRRYGCAWPCPATHNDHVPLWDALPPPPPPPGSPPPNIRLAMQMMIQAPMLQQQNMLQPPMMQQPPNMMQQPPNMMQQPPNMLQQPPNMLQQPPQLLQQPPQMLQQPPQLLQQPPQMMPQPGVKPMMSTPFPMPSKLDPSVSLPNFLPPEPPPGLLSFPITSIKTNIN